MPLLSFEDEINCAIDECLNDFDIDVSVRSIGGPQEVCVGSSSGNTGDGLLGMAASVKQWWIRLCLERQF